MSQNEEMQGLQLPRMPGQETQQEPVYYMEAANGMTVRVPESKLEAWEAAQNRQRQQKGPRERSATQQRLIESVVSAIYNSTK